MGKRQAGSIRGYAGVGHYLQGPGAIRRLPQAVQEYGQSALILIDSWFFDEWSAEFERMFRDSGLTCRCVRFEGECSPQAVHNLVELVSGLDSRVDVLAGMGGGKTMDTVRAASREVRAALVQIPTSASTNAATSCLAVVYGDDHVGRAAFLPRDPDYVIADTDIIITAPVRMLAAGIGDALATYYEARSCWSTNNVNYVSHLYGGCRPTICGKAAARTCLDTLLTCGREACQAARNHIRTEAFEDTVEAIFLLSGIGWENNGTAIAHALVEGIPLVRETRQFLHGECVAFCVLVQMILDRDSREDFQRVYSLCSDLHLPVCLADLGITEDRESKVRFIVESAFEIDDGMRIANYDCTPDMVYSAILYLDSLKDPDHILHV